MKNFRQYLYLSLSVVLITLLFPYISKSFVTTAYAQDSYDSKQVASLTKFLDSKDSNDTPNYQKLGLTAGYNISDISDVIWDNDSIKQIIEINFENKQLTGELDLTNTPSVQTIDISNNQISKLSLTKESAVTMMDLSNNELTSIDLSGCTKLVTANLSSNYIQSVILPSECYIDLLDVRDNLLNFNTIPSGGNIKKLKYSNQKDTFVIAHSQVNGIYADKKADFSFYGADSYSWFDNIGNPVSPKVDGSIMLFSKDFLEKRLYCVMTSKRYPDLTLRTEQIVILQKDYSLLILLTVFILLGAALWFVVKFYSRIIKGGIKK